MKRFLIGFFALLLVLSLFPVALADGECLDIDSGYVAEHGSDIVLDAEAVYSCIEIGVGSVTIDGNGASIIYDGTSDTGIDIFDKDTVEMSNFAEISGFDVAIDITSGYTFEFTDMAIFVEGDGAIGIEASDARDVIVNSVHITTEADGGELSEPVAVYFDGVRGSSEITSSTFDILGEFDGLAIQLEETEELYVGFNTFVVEAEGSEATVTDYASTELTFVANTITIEESAGFASGFYLTATDDLYMDENSVSGENVGMVLERARDGYVVHNDFFTDYPVYLSEVEDVILESNTIVGDSMGIEVIESTMVHFDSNHVEVGSSGDSAALEAYSLTDSTFIGNTFEVYHGESAVILEDSERNTFSYDNFLVDGTDTVVILERSNDNSFSHTTFMSDSEEFESVEAHGEDIVFENVLFEDRLAFSATVTNVYLSFGEELEDLGLLEGVVEYPFNFEALDEVSTFTLTAFVPESISDEMAEQARFFEHDGIEDWFYLDSSVDSEARSVVLDSTYEFVETDEVLIGLLADTVAPEVSLVCDADSVNLGESVTCTCTATDDLELVSQSFEEVVYTEEAIGTYDVECVAMDLSGNEGVAVTSFEVVDAGTGTDSGSSSGSTGRSARTEPTIVNVLQPEEEVQDATPNLEDNALSNNIEDVTTAEPAEDAQEVGNDVPAIQGAFIGPGAAKVVVPIVLALGVLVAGLAFVARRRRL